MARKSKRHFSSQESDSRTNLKRKFQFESLETRTLLSAEFASFDGSGNNLENPDWGSTDEQLLRLVSVEYADQISAPAGEGRASAREISNEVVAQNELVTNDRFLTDFVWLWGQFIDHDIDLTEGAEPAESFNINVPAGDIHFDPTATGEQVIELHRSVYDEETGDSLGNPRQQINQITAYLDGSVIYGSDAERSAALRTFAGGLLKTSEGDLLPFNEMGLPNAGGPSDRLFLAGDVRANENAALTAMHTLFVREHNRVAQELAQADPSLTDEELYQYARAIVTAELQSITYNEFLPALLGPEAIAKYEGYDPAVNVGISNLFSTAAYRFGHSMLSPELLRVDEFGNEIAAGNLSLQDAFFAPQQLIENGIDSLLSGLARQEAQEIDSMIVDDVRNFLFGPPGAGGFDLASLNIQRGRDHGLPDYNQARIDLGLAPITSFAEITSDLELQATLEDVYGDVDSIDAWVGGLAEDHVPGASVGELVYTVLVDQFERIRNGDRFWYQNVYHGEALELLESTTLADVIQRNTGIDHIRSNVFMLAQNHVPTADIGGPYVMGNHNLVRFNAGHSYDLEQSTDSLKYYWDFDNDGKFDDAVGQRPYFSTAEMNGANRALVRVKVVDNNGFYGGDKAIVFAVGKTSLRLSGDTDGVVGQMRRITLTPAAATSASLFSYEIDWGDGTPVRTVRGRSGAIFGNSYDDEGTYRIKVTATDLSTRDVTTAQHTVSIGTLELQGDDLALSGTDHDDLFQLIGQSNSSAVEVLFNGQSQGLFDVAGRIQAFGLAGNDTFIGAKGGIDILFDGGDGDDTAYTYDGNDILYGRAGNDALYSYAGDNYINAGSGDDTIRAALGNDRIIAGTGDDEVRDAGGNNFVDARQGNNEIDTGSGNDWIMTGAGIDLITTGGGDNLIDAGDGENRIITGVGNDKIYSGRHNDWVLAYGGKNVILTHDGDDTIFARGDGPNRVVAGEGNNRVSAEITEGPLHDDQLNRLLINVFS